MSLLASAYYTKHDVATRRASIDLHYAIVRDALCAFGHNLRAGADPQWLNEKGHTPITAICHRNGRHALDMVRCIVEVHNKKLTALDQPALSFAALHGNIALMEYLVAHGADANAVGEADHTPLRSAARGGQHVAYQWLIGRGAQVEVRLNPVDDRSTR